MTVKGILWLSYSLVSVFKAPGEGGGGSTKITYMKRIEGNDFSCLNI
jgi:hypothetical protein